MTFHSQIFVPTLAVGLPLAVAGWCCTRERSRASWLWRLGLSFLTAVAVTPTVCSICGQPGIFPAYFIAFFALPGNAGALTHGLPHGVLPLLGSVALVFTLSTASVRLLRRSHEAG